MPSGAAGYAAARLDLVEFLDPARAGQKAGLNAFAVMSPRS